MTKQLMDAVGAGKKFPPRPERSTLPFTKMIWVPVAVFACVLSAQAQAPNAAGQPGVTSSSAAGTPAIDAQTLGSVSGTVVDGTGLAIPGARVSLTRTRQTNAQEVTTGLDGIFSFTNLPAGDYSVVVAASGFNAQTSSFTLHPGEIFVNPTLTMSLAGNVTEVQVVAPRAEVAEAEIKLQEKQRVLGVIPNFYVSYIPDAVPLDPKQKFELAWKSVLDPVTFVFAGAAAGFEQSQDAFHGYGQGAQGYAKRFGASYGDTVVGTFVGSALLPSILKQDPRYFYKGTGSTHSRLLYALANAVITKGDNKKWQPNYSSIGGSFVAGGISNLYYPSEERGAANTIENALIAIGESAAANVFQEFVVKKFTPSLTHHHPES